MELVAIIEGVGHSFTECGGVGTAQKPIPKPPTSRLLRRSWRILGARCLTHGLNVSERSERRSFDVWALCAQTRLANEVSGVGFAP